MLMLALLCVAGVFAGAGATAPSTCAASDSNARQYHFQLGDYNATVIYDQTLSLPNDGASFAYPPEKTSALLAQAYLPPDEVLHLPLLPAGAWRKLLQTCAMVAHGNLRQAYMIMPAQHHISLLCDAYVTRTGWVHACQQCIYLIMRAHTSACSEPLLLLLSQ